MSQDNLGDTFEVILLTNFVEVIDQALYWSFLAFESIEWFDELQLLIQLRTVVLSDISHVHAQKLSMTFTYPRVIY